jgi:CHAD domain-containing protein
VRRDLSTPGGYHEVRRAVRRLRDTIEVFAEALGNSDRRWRRRLQPIQGLLGALNDTDTAMTLLARAPKRAQACHAAIAQHRVSVLCELAPPLCVAAIEVLRA